jgi:hypothetical protein
LHIRLHEEPKPHVLVYFLFCVKKFRYQLKIIVKVHRVFPSCCLNNFASARRVQFHQVKTRDSGAVVTPFMQVGTYPTRDFATLEPSELQLPFIGTYILNLNQKNLNKKISSYNTGQASDPIPHFSILQSPVFLINSRHSIFSTI